MTFKGWSDEALDFFEGLEADNSKAYWQANKPNYESAVREPMELLVAELEPKLGPGKIFRPYRDVRFSKNKAPYKENVAAIIGSSYIQLSSAGLAVGGGMWELESDQLQRYREAVDDDTTGKKLASLVKKAEESGLLVISHGELKTAPRGYAKDHPRIRLLRYKGIATWQEWPPAKWLGTAKAKEHITDSLRKGRPIATWLEANVGPSTLPPSSRYR